MKICKKNKNVFFYKKDLRDYIQLYSQLYLSEVYSEQFCDISFTKSQIILLRLLKTYLLACGIFM